MRWAPLLALLLIGCGSSSPVGPSPVSTPPATFHGTVTDTVSGAAVVGFSATMSGSRVTVSAPGYLTRETSGAAASVDLIPDAAPFDLTFYRQFARNALDNGTPDVLRVLPAAPSIYLQRTGLSDANVAALEAAARAVVPALTGGKFQVLAWETGTEDRADRAGWITAHLVTDDGQHCGFTTSIGAGAGHITLNTAPKCARRGFTIEPSVLAHELGHALGFGHVSDPNALMAVNVNPGATPTSAERYHAAIAYHRQAGSKDVDVDP